MGGNTRRWLLRLARLRWL